MRTPALHRNCIYQLHCTSFSQDLLSAETHFDSKQMFVIAIIAHILQKEKQKNPVITMTGFFPKLQ